MSGVRTREMEVLRCLGCYRYLSRGQLEAFLFDGAARSACSRDVLTRRVLARLKARGLVAATPRLVGGPGGGSGRLAYFLTSAGSRLAGAATSHGSTRRQPNRGTFLVAHSLLAADVALAFRRAARLHQGHDLQEWQADWQTAERLGTTVVVPDAHVVYATEAWRLDAFIEVDLATEGTRFFSGKIRRYLELYRSGSWRAHLPTWPVVLTVTPTIARATALRVATESLFASRADGERLAKATKFAFGSLDDVLGRLGPLGEIWQVAGRSGRHALVAEGSDSAGPGRRDESANAPRGGSMADGSASRDGRERCEPYQHRYGAPPT